MQIELRPHVGLDVRTKQPVDLEQDMVFLDGRHVGFVGRRPGAPVNFVERLPGSTVQAVLDHVERAREQAPQRWSEPPAVVLPPPEEQDEE